MSFRIENNVSWFSSLIKIILIKWLCLSSDFQLQIRGKCKNTMRPCMTGNFIVFVLWVLNTGQSYLKMRFPMWPTNYEIAHTVELKVLELLQRTGTIPVACQIIFQGNLVNEVLLFQIAFFMFHLLHINHLSRFKPFQSYLLRIQLQKWPTMKLTYLFNFLPNNFQVILK